MVSMEELLHLMVQRRGSDLHLSVGAPPKIRIDGQVIDTEYEILQPEVTKKIIYSVLTPDQVAKFEKNLEIDFSFGVANLGRFRTNAFMQRGTIGAVLARDSVRGVRFRANRHAVIGLRMDLWSAQRSDPLHRCHWLRQVDDTGFVDRLHQRAPARSHHDDRGSDRVPPSQQELFDQPARDRR